MVKKDHKNMLNKFLTLVFLISLFLNQTNTVLASSLRVNEAQTQFETGDVRVKILEAYLNKYKSPLAPEAKNFVEAADKYNIDWKFVAAIAGNESTFGKHTPGYQSYNAWGWGVYGTQAIYFKSWKDGIYTVSEGLRKNYYNRGLTNTYSIARVYAASPTWAAHVTFFLNDMTKFEKEYRAEYTRTEEPKINVTIAGTSAALRAKS